MLAYKVLVAYNYISVVSEPSQRKTDSKYMENNTQFLRSDQFKHTLYTIIFFVLSVIYQSI